MNRLLTISMVVALILLAINGQRIVAALSDAFAPAPPADLIIVAPAGAEKV